MYVAPDTTAPSAAWATVPGLYGTSPTVADTGLSAGTAPRISLITHGKFAPRDPSSGFLTSTMSRCSAAFAQSRASSTLSGEMRSNNGGLLFTHLVRLAHARTPP